MGRFEVACEQPNNINNSNHKKKVLISIIENKMVEYTEVVRMLNEVWCDSYRWSNFSQPEKTASTISAQRIGEANVDP